MVSLNGSMNFGFGSVVAATAAMAGISACASQTLPILSPAEIAAAIRREEFLVPFPSDLFAALDAAAKPSWSRWLRGEPPLPPENREAMALLTGALVADACVAIEAQDARAVQDVTRDIFALAGRLGAGEPVLGRARSLADFAETGEWVALREELEATQNEIRLELVACKDDALATLIVAGAWLRALERAAAMVQESGVPDAARLLAVPGPGLFLAERMENLAARETPAVVRAREAFLESAAFARNPDSSEALADLAAKTQQALQAIGASPSQNP